MDLPVGCDVVLGMDFLKKQHVLADFANMRANCFCTIAWLPLTPPSIHTQLRSYMYLHVFTCSYM